MHEQIDWLRHLDALTTDSIGGLVVDEEFHVRAITDDVLLRSGLERADVIDTSALDLLHPTDIGRAAAVIGRAVPDQRAEAPGLYRLIADTGTWDIYQMEIVHLGDSGDNAVVLELHEAGVDARAHAIVEDVASLTDLLVEPEGLRSSFRAIADFAERNIDRLSLAITIFAEDGTAATFCERELDAESNRQNEAAHPLSLPAHVVESYGKAKIRTWRSDNEVGTIMPNRPDRMTMVLLDLDENLLGYVDAFRATPEPPSTEEWRTYRLVSQMLRAVMLNAQLEVRLGHLRTNDPLTGLTNRHSLLTRMAGADLEKSGVVVLNLDGFAWVNSAMGFAAGDTVLTSVAASVLSAAPAGAVVSRLGGDEFVVWIPSPPSATSVFRLAERLRKAISVPLDNADRRGRTRVSIGATTVFPNETADEAIHRAVEAMRESKEAGGDRVSHR